MLIAARELVKHEAEPQGTNVEWAVIANGLQRLREALADLEGDSTGTANSIKKNTASVAPQSLKGR